MAEFLREASPWAIATEVGYDGARAVQFAMAGMPDVAILDVDMPILSGVEAALAIRAEFGSKRPFLVAMTGHPESARSLRTRLAFDVVLAKPMDMEVLLRHLSDELARRSRSTGVE